MAQFAVALAAGATLADLDPEALELGLERVDLKPFRELVSVGDERAIEATLAAYRDAGVDRLYLLPVSRSADQVERLARVAGLPAGGG